MDGLRLDRSDDGVATITIDQPAKKNAMSGEMFRAFGQLCRDLNGDGTVRAVLITGAGSDFCSGADVSGIAEPTGTGPVQGMRSIGSTVMALHEVQQPVVAKVRGVAAGAGLNLALAGDLIIASETARFSEIFARRALSIDFGGSWLLPRLIGVHRAKELTLLADVISAAEADRIGLVNRVVPDDELDQTCDEIVHRLAAGPSVALAMSKRLLNAGLTSSLTQALEAEGVAQSLNFTTGDVVEAITAFRERREPRFQGR